MDSKLVGNFIRKRRMSLKFTQRQVAEMLNFQTCQFISNIERGIADIPPSRIKDFADVLQISANDLAGMVSDSMKNKLLKKTLITLPMEGSESENKDPFIESFLLSWRTANDETKECIKFFVSKVLNMELEDIQMVSASAGRPNMNNANMLM